MTPVVDINEKYEKDLWSDCDSDKRNVTETFALKTLIEMKRNIK